MAEARLRRSLLMTPGNRPERLRKAFGYGADCVVFDLEDSVPPDAKAQARACVADAVRAVDRRGRELCVRINTLASGFGVDDLAALPLAQVDSIMLPKVESAAQLREVERLLAELRPDRGRAQPLELIVMLETPRGVLRALEIAEATPRTTALFFGSGDYTAATGAALTPNALLFARSAIVAAAGATGAQAIDAAYFVDVKNAQATREDALAARELGFAGKVVFHPVQVGVANEVFSPTDAEIARAERLVRAYREALASGHGTAVADGVFVAVDLVAPAEKLLRRAAPRSRASAANRHLPEETRMPLSERPVRLQRCELAVPATSPRFFAKAAASAADTLFLDLEDAVAPAQKDAARRQAIEALNNVDWGSKTVAVRVNGLDTPWALQDIVEVARHAPRLDLVLLPKTGSGFDVRFVDQVLTLIERETGRTKRTGIEVLIETAKGVANVEEIAQASDRLEAMIFGVGDYTVDMRTYDQVFGRPSERYAVLTDADGAGARQRHWNDQWHFAMARIANACRAYGLRPIDGPFTDFGDAEGYRACARRAQALGFEGKWAIHPSQIALANEVFSPSAEELAWAERVRALLAQTTRDGQGAVGDRGVLVDMAHLKLADSLLDRHRQILSSRT